MIRDDNHDVLLFAILKIDEISDRWSVVYSEPQANTEEQRKEIFVYLVNKLIANLNEEENRSIARVVVYPSDDHLVENLLKFKANYQIKESTPINGNIVHEGYILASS